MKKAADYGEPTAFWREIIADQQRLLALAKQLGRLFGLREEGHRRIIDRDQRHRGQAFRFASNVESDVAFRPNFGGQDNPGYRITNKLDAPGMFDSHDSKLRFLPPCS